ncbi:MAG: hypothetical protein VZQ81_07465 [Succiniclasticum sp.]|nr:hypothetical protein [Succiniclasticum sp.]MEE3479845.1 hypothetical protein [Succiniclasticum sp.]
MAVLTTRNKSARRGLRALARASCLLAVAAALFSAAPQPVRAGVYTEELGEMQTLLQDMVVKQSRGQTDTAPDREDLMAVWESARNLPPDEVFNQTRYVLADINGDGEGELLTGDAEGRITNLYTQQGGRPRHVKSGFVRDACYYLGGNRFLSTGSTGGRNMVLSLWHLDKQGSPVCDQYYYTREAEADPARQEVYVGTDPNTDGAAAKKSTYTVGELNDLRQQYEGKRFSLPWRPLADFGNQPVEITFFNLGGAKVQLEYTATRYVKDFHVVQVEAVPDGGSFRQRLVQDLPAGDLALAESFRGEPCVNGARSQFLTDGFTYRDHTGRRHYYQFHYSGADGSLIGSEEQIPW